MARALLDERLRVGEEVGGREGLLVDEAAVHVEGALQQPAVHLLRARARARARVRVRVGVGVGVRVRARVRGSNRPAAAGRAA